MLADRSACSSRAACVTAGTLPKSLRSPPPTPGYYTRGRTPRGVHPVNSPRAGRQQGSTGSGGCAESPFALPAPLLSVPVGSLADVALALYRKYRPAKFADVVGQEHVTEPLSRAIEA